MIDIWGFSPILSLALRAFSFQVVKYCGYDDAEEEECEDDVNVMKVKPVGMEGRLMTKDADQLVFVQSNAWNKLKVFLIVSKEFEVECNSCGSNYCIRYQEPMA